MLQATSDFYRWIDKGEDDGELERELMPDKVTDPKEDKQNEQ